MRTCPNVARLGEFFCKNSKGSSTKAILSGDGERHHLALWRADAHGAMEAGMISENRYKPFTPVSRDAPSLDRLTGWHMLALVGSAAEVRRRARGAAGDFISEGGRDARTYLYVDGAKWGHTASIVDCALKAFGCPTTRIQVAGKQLPEFPSSHTTVEVYTMALDDKQVAARFLSASGMSGGGGAMITAADAAAAAAGGGVLANAGALSSALSSRPITLSFCAIELAMSSSIESAGADEVVAALACVGAFGFAASRLRAAS